ncbi:hypothetical protein SDRG_11508 [Saprolegnia diclina VS20]|uniref:Nudix hydrolase domain-containing protein n=1 Tax=Saprolegnia diclina (strain VS20) TaxID=1156394 RepID=T0REM5_SAPDV|nr:hypothetical protein SDRG_11508 [Saprolegnia diclina VS20]EQC30748.1 hypothetical protein SDRG_11508 [Saprolegnia diclina VS20]|eukprot:XP_008615772.1 hypothetical protein SDRG_11508 [Saprolegnia diclina VS20]
MHVAAFFPRLQATLQALSPTHLASRKRASVAALFRHAPGPDPRLQLLFIRRCVNPNDTWSGHIAFPGGRTQPSETDVESAIRETREEIGLDLDRGFRLVGQLHDRPVHYGTTVVASFVFQHDGQTPFKMTLEPSEVADAVWVDVAYLASAPIQSLEIPVDMIFPWLTTYPSLLARLQKSTILSAIGFPCIYLPRPKEENDVVDATAPRQANNFVLWGLTYTMVSDLFVAGGLDALPMTSRSLRYARSFLFHWRRRQQRSTTK